MRGSPLSNPARRFYELGSVDWRLHLVPLQHAGPAGLQRGRDGVEQLDRGPQLLQAGRLEQELPREDVHTADSGEWGGSCRHGRMPELPEAPVTVQLYLRAPEDLHHQPQADRLHPVLALEEGVQTQKAEVFITVNPKMVSARSLPTAS